MGPHRPLSRSQMRAHLSLFSLQSALHSTPRLSPAQHSPGPEEAGGVRLRPPPRSWGGAKTQAEEGNPEAACGRTPQTGGDPGAPSPGHSPSWPLLQSVQDPLSSTGSFSRVASLGPHSSPPPRPATGGVNKPGPVQFPRPRDLRLGQGWSEAAAEGRTSVRGRVGL